MWRGYVVGSTLDTLKWKLSHCHCLTRTPEALGQDHTMGLFKAKHVIIVEEYEVQRTLLS